MQLEGSEAPDPPAPGAAPATGRTTSVTVYLRGADPAPGVRVERGRWAADHGATEADVAAVLDHAAAAGLSVVEVDRARRAVVLAGPAADVAGAFGTGVAEASPGGPLAPTGPLALPPDLAGVVTAVVGLDERPRARTQFRPAADPTGGFTPVQVADAYGFPPGTDGGGQVVGIIELGGGYRPADLQAYFAALGTPVPAVSSVGVDGGANAPGAASGPDGEVMLDIEVVGAVAPGARIVVYFAPNTEQGFVDAVSSAAHDTTNRPSVLSISWGGPEDGWSAAGAQQMEAVLTQAAALGVSVCVASGDGGSADRATDGRAHVDFPAAAPHALACGGTRLTVGPSGPAEVVWDELDQGGGASGGGISARFAVPAYQAHVALPPPANPGAGPGRGVPDVAGDADPQTGYRVRVDGQDTVIGGTSAVAPLWAALLARCNQALGRAVGDVHAALYAAPGALRDITTGSNGAYQAGVGWDCCTGLGSPDGAAVLAALRAHPGA